MFFHLVILLDRKANKRIYVPFHILLHKFQKNVARSDEAINKEPHNLQRRWGLILCWVTN